MATYRYIGPEAGRAGLPVEPFGEGVFPAADLASFVERGLIEVLPGEVWELDETGARLLHAAGSPGAEQWAAENSEPHDLTPVVPRGKRKAAPKR